MKILVTGGAGFIGSHLTDALLARGHEVRVYDSLDPQVHGPGCLRPPYLNANAELVQADVRARDPLARALLGIDAVFHLASAVGVGQSMYDIRRYVDVNSVGTATLLDVIVNEARHVRRLVLASSMSNYGEGAYDCARCGEVHPRLRPVEQLASFVWDVRCPRCGTAASIRPTGEDKPLFPTSVYATTKRDQEEMFCEIGLAYGISTTVLRYFNVYGSRQALSNPYTGVVAIFANAFLAKERPVLFEDGGQVRDFVHVRDIIAANLLALQTDLPGVHVMNVGTGRPTTLRQLSESLASAVGADPALLPEPSNRFRAGDIRACVADVSRAGRVLGYQPQVTLADGMAELMVWLAAQGGTATMGRALSELHARGLVS